jgi:hypothetical protein
MRREKVTLNFVRRSAAGGGDLGRVWDSAAERRKPPRRPPLEPPGCRTAAGPHCLRHVVSLVQISRRYQRKCQSGIPAGLPSLGNHTAIATKISSSKISSE